MCAAVDTCLGSLTLYLLRWYPGDVTGTPGWTCVWEYMCTWAAGNTKIQELEKRDLLKGQGPVVARISGSLG